MIKQICRAILLLLPVLVIFMASQVEDHDAKEMDKMKDLVKRIIPRLSPELHKGQAGKVGVLGGSYEYTGAPYYAGISALKMGADLSHIFCSSDAATAIKSYSPELIVHPLLCGEGAVDQYYDSIAYTLDREEDQEQRRRCNREEKKAAIVQHAVHRMEKMMERLDVLVIGPGMGRDPLVLKTVSKVIERARALNLPLVVDGDGLFLVSQKPDLIRGYTRAIMTPNVVEFGRLVDALDGNNSGLGVKEVAKKFGGVTVLQKGGVDKISDGLSVIANSHPGSPRRCGGQGDIIAGILGTMAAWASKDLPRVEGSISGTKGKFGREREIDGHGVWMVAAFGAAIVTKASAAIAYEESGRATTTPDIINSIGRAHGELFTNEEASKL